MLRSLSALAPTGVALGAAATLLLAGSAAAQFPNGPCWETNLGTPLGATDDWLSGAQALSHPFPLPGGGTTNSIDISSNGFVWLDPADPLNNGNDLSEDVVDFLSFGPRIAVLWNDLTTSSGTNFPGGDVYINTSFPNRTVITWLIRDFGGTDPNDVQLQLNADGSFSIKYKQLASSTNDALVGITPGNAAVDPGAVDFTQMANMGGGTTVYHIGRAGLAGNGLLFFPNGTGYDAFNVPTCLEPAATVTTYGAGCPAPMGGSIYEHFEGAAGNDTFDLPAGSTVLYNFLGTGYGVQSGGGNFDPNIGTQVAWNGSSTGDDSLSTQMLPFAFPLPGGGTTSSIDVCSNGYVWLVAGSSTTTGYNPDVDDFQSATEPARIAALWTDFNNNPSSTTGGGTVAFNAGPTKATITWDQVPTFGNAGSLSTVQLQMFSNGNFLVVFQSVNLGSAGIVGDECLTGFTVGNNTANPAETDYSAALPALMPFAETPNTPMLFDAAAGQLPLLNSTITLEATDLSGSPVAVLFAGLAPQSTDLSIIGMPGCTLYAFPDAQAPMTVGGNVATFTYTIPATPTLAGAKLYNQAVGLAMVNPLGLIASNGVELQLGSF